MPHIEFQTCHPIRQIVRYRALKTPIMTSELWNVDYFEMTTVGWRANLVLFFLLT